MREPAHGVNGRKFTKIMFDTPRREALLPSTMKKLLSLLMCYVFLQAETFALRGGPGSSGNTRLQGSYSAILVQTSPLYDVITGAQVGTEPGNGLGLVTLTVPTNGPAVGNLLIFDSQTGNTFLGKANGLSNPRTGDLTCLVAGTEFRIATTSATAGVTGATTLTNPETIAGNLIASKSKIRSKSSEIVGTANLTVSGIRFVSVVSGVTVNFVGNGVPATYDLIGYLTSADAVASTFDLTGSN